MENISNNIINFKYYNTFYTQIFICYNNQLKELRNKSTVKYTQSDFDKLIIINKSFEQKTIYPIYNFTDKDFNILRQKYNYAIDLTPYDKFFLEIQINKRSFSPVMTNEQRNTYNKLKLNHLKELQDKIKKTNTKYWQIEYQILLILTEMEESFITKKESDKFIDDKIKNLNRFIEVLQKEKFYLEEKNLSEKDNLTKWEQKERIIRINHEIMTKKSFIRHYSEKRKNVL